LADGQIDQIAALPGGTVLSNGSDPTFVGCRHHLYAVTGRDLSSSTLTQMSLTGTATHQWTIPAGARQR
jgi:hypothetical protein